MSLALKNLKRLLAPRSLAFVGGRSMAQAVRRCMASFEGPVWLINPHHTVLEGVPCHARLEDLPGIPDGVFLGVNSVLTETLVAQLSALGVGGTVCYASGFAETGPEGQVAQAGLVAAAGDMALLGPNCFGLVDCLHGAALWPVAHGGQRVTQGAAILTQSGNFAYNLSMCSQSLPLAYLISVGNQAQLGVAELMDALLDDPRITAIGLHLEGLKDLPGFSRAAYRALERGVPIVALKVGVSEKGAALALGHTSALAGSDVLYNALFDRLGILRVKGASSFTETLRAATVGLRPVGPELLALTCSGGDAGFVADHADEAGLELPALTHPAQTALAAALPAYAQPANPLDFTTAVWGDRAALGCVLDGMLDQSQPHACLLVLDMPEEASGERGPCEMLLDLFAERCHAAGRPALVAPVFQSLMPSAMAARLQRAGIVVFQSLQEGLMAWGRLVRYWLQRPVWLDRGEAALPLLPVPLGHSQLVRLDEWASRQALRLHGVPFAPAQNCGVDEVLNQARQMPFPLAMKVISPQLPHKTEVGGVALGLHDLLAVSNALEAMRNSLSQRAPDVLFDRVLLEPMAPAPVAELLVGVRREPGFGLALVIGLGGITVELLKDTRSLLLPTNVESVRAAVNSLRLAPLLTGYRARASADLEAAVQAIMALAHFASVHAAHLLELEVNPLLLHSQGCTAVDALICLDENVPLTSEIAA